LALGLVDNHHLATLDLNWNEIGDIGTRALASVLGVNQTLNSLILGANCIGVLGV